jgi:hypothetical protein
VKYPDSRLLVLARAPEPGKVKTRLAASLGTNAAAELYEKLLHGCLEMSVSADLCPVEIWCSPSPQHAFFQHCRDRYHTGLYPQVKGDIGQRMSHAIMSALQRAEHAVLIGADCPALGHDDLDRAFNALQQGADVVLGPAEDGGYYLIGMSGCYPSLFENIPWSTQNVLALTETRMRERGLNWHSLPVRRDVDTAEDYAVYMASMPRH